MSTSYSDLPKLYYLSLYTASVHKYKVLKHGSFYRIRKQRICLKILFSIPGSF